MKDEGDTFILEGIAELRWLSRAMRQVSPDTAAYAVIRMFFETNYVSDELKLSFITWLTNGCDCKAKDRALERRFCEFVEERRKNGSTNSEGWVELSERLNLFDKESSLN